MFNRFKHSLRFKLTMLLMVIMTMTIFGSLALTQLYVKTFLLGELKYNMVNMYNEINSVFAKENVTADEIKERLAVIAAQSDVNIFVLQEDGTVYSNTNEEGKMRESMRSIASLLRGVDEKDLESLFSDNPNHYFVFHQNHDQKMDTDFYDLVGTLDDGSLVALRSSALKFRQSVNATVKLYFYIGMIAIFVGCIAMFFVSSAYVKPIRDMALSAKRMAQLDFDTKVLVNSKTEIGELGQSINSMSRELETTISELKSANAQLTKDIEKKTQIDEMRKEFLSHVSHELKTPIALIQGYAEGLKENVSDDPESKEFYCEVIMDEAEKMNQMVKKLLALNELEFGTNHALFERFDIVELIKNVNASSEILLQQKNLRLDFNVDGPMYVWADEFMIGEVYTNYLTNAINHTAEQGGISITIEEQEDILRINVFNEGELIPEEDIDKIWIKFYKVDKARTREYGGSGIGLSIVAATMKLHGREYGAYNGNNGVNFYFELECAKQKQTDEKC